MQRLLTLLKKQNGYVSIEVTIVMGLVIGFGAVLLSTFNQTGLDVTNRAINYSQNAFDSNGIQAIFGKKLF